MASRAPSEGKMFTPSEIASKLRLSLGSVYHLIHSGALPAVNLAVRGRGCYRVKPESLEKFLNDRMVTAPAQTPKRSHSRLPPVKDYLGS